MTWVSSIILSKNKTKNTPLIFTAKMTTSKNKKCLKDDCKNFSKT